MENAQKEVENAEKSLPSSDSLARARAFVGFSATNHRVDWFRLIVQLKAKGYSLSMVGYFTGIPKETLAIYKQGSQPSYHRGVTLLQFWAEVMDCDTNEAPTISPYSFKA